MITAASSTSVAAVIPAAVHSPREDEEAATGAAAAVDRGVAEDGCALALLAATWLSGGTRVPTGWTVGAALKPQSSSEAASR